MVAHDPMRERKTWQIANSLLTGLRSIYKDVITRCVGHRRNVQRAWTVATVFMVSLYRRGERRACDCLPDFYPTKERAIEEGAREVARVAAIEPGQRDRTMDFAYRFTIKAVHVSDNVAYVAYQRSAA